MSGPRVIVKKGPLGNWNGYIGVPEGHPWFGKHYDSLPDVEVHGGLTFSRGWNPETGKPDGLWWLGFDTSHLDDATPEIGVHDGHLWTREEVGVETAALALRSVLP